MRFVVWGGRSSAVLMIVFVVGVGEWSLGELFRFCGESFCSLRGILSNV